MKSGLSEIDRFFSQVQAEPNSGCWFWDGSLTVEGGYGQFGIKRDGKWRTVRAHVYSYEAFVGLKPQGETRIVVMHKCDVPSCVNPRHLTVGTDVDNMQDAISKGRMIPGIANRSLTHCKNGHPFAGTNVVQRGNRRHCKTCNRRRTAEYRARKEAVCHSSTQ